MSRIHVNGVDAIAVAFVSSNTITCTIPAAAAAAVGTLEFETVSGGPSVDSVDFRHADPVVRQTQARARVCVCVRVCGARRVAGWELFSRSHLAILARAAGCLLPCAPPPPPPPPFLPPFSHYLACCFRLVQLSDVNPSAGQASLSTVITITGSDLGLLTSDITSVTVGGAGPCTEITGPFLSSA